MVRAAKSAPRTVSSDPWQARARAKKWPEQDISSIEDILRIGKDTAVVTRVEYSSITLCTISHDDNRRHGWKWHRVDVAEPKFVTQKTEERPWCPFHGWGCDPTPEGCGHERVLFYTLCDCPSRGHFHDCEAFLRLEQDKADAKAKTEPQVEVSTERKRKKERTASTQMRLDIR